MPVWGGGCRRRLCHATVKLTLKDGAQWFDPTRSDQAGDIVHAAPPDYGFALPLTGPQQTALQPIPIDAKIHKTCDSQPDFLFGRAGVFILVTSTYRTACTDWERAFLARTSLLKLRDDLTKYNASDCPGITFFAPLIVTDDPVQNVINTKQF